jgi:hypothetical protein
LLPFCSWNKNPAFTYAWAFWALGIIWKCKNCVMKNMNHQHTHCNAVSNSIIQILSLLGRIKVKIMDTCLMCNMCSCKNKKNAYLIYSGCNLHSLECTRNGFPILKSGKYKKLRGTQIVLIHSHNFLIS